MIYVYRLEILFKTDLLTGIDLTSWKLQNAIVQREKGEGNTTIMHVHVFPKYL
jgi:hypothetical protein